VITNHENILQPQNE